MPSMSSRSAVSTVSRHVKITLINNIRAPCQLNCTSRGAYSNSARPGYAAADSQENDMVGGVLSSCLRGAAHLADTTIKQLADALQSVAPPQAPRHKVEVSVKGALVLLLLGLLKGVISFVLLVGCIGLAVYTATQVFGWNALLLGQHDTFGGPRGWQQQQQQQRYPSDRGPFDQDPFQQQQRHQGPAAQPEPPYRQAVRSRAAAAHQPRRQQADQGDVVDVFTYGHPASSQ